MSRPQPALHPGFDRRVEVRSYVLAKLQEEPEKADDACEVLPSRGLFAVADGATEGRRCGEWARALVEHACKEGLPSKEKLPRWLEAPRERWLSGESEQAAWPFRDRGRADDVGASTLLALELTCLQDDSFRWRAAAVGDSCLFLVREEKLLETWPCTSVSDFGLHPALLFSRPGFADGVLHRRQGEARQGDMFVLATDALAAWLLGEDQKGNAPWKEIVRFLAPGMEHELQARMEELRSKKHMKDDDVTLVLIVVKPSQHVASSRHEPPLKPSSPAPPRSQPLPPLPPSRPSVLVCVARWVLERVVFPGSFIAATAWVCARRAPLEAPLAPSPSPSSDSPGMVAPPRPLQPLPTCPPSPSSPAPHTRYISGWTVLPVAKTEERVLVPTGTVLFAAKLRGQPWKKMRRDTACAPPNLGGQPATFDCLVLRNEGYPSQGPERWLQIMANAEVVEP